MRPMMMVLEVTMRMVTRRPAKESSVTSSLGGAWWVVYILSLPSAFGLTPFLDVAHLLAHLRPSL